jgi:hypothetical protein
MKSLWGSFKGIFRGKPKNVEDEVAKKAAARAAMAGGGGGGGGDPAAGGSGASGSTAARASVALGGPRGGGGGGGVGGGASAAAAPLSDEDQLLAAIEKNVGRLGEMGRTMGSELEKQDAMIDRLSLTTERAHAGLQRNAKEAARQAKSA